MVGVFPSVMLIVSDLNQSLRFYCGQLGMSLSDQDEWDDGHRVAYLAFRDFKLVLFQQPPSEQFPAPPPPAGFRGDGVLLSFQVESLYLLADALKSMGATVLRDVKKAPWGEKTLMVTDPDGYAILLAEQTAYKA